MFQVRLRVLGGKYDGRIIALKGRKFVVGREQDCHLRPNSDQISRHHCVFSMDEYSVRLKDLGSTNGTFVDGERIDGDRVLMDGDEVGFGDLKFRVMIRDLSAEEAAQQAAKQAAPASSDSQIIAAADLASTPAASEGDTREFKIDQQPSAEPKPAEPAPVAAEAQQSPPPAPQPEPPMPAPAGPPQYPGYQMPQYPGYPQQNWYYPQMPWGYQGMPQQPYPQPYPQQPYPQPYYPQQQYPQPGYPGQYGGQYGGPQPEPQQPAPPQEEVSAEDLGITLPDPATTGAKDEPKPAADQPAAQEAGTKKDPSQMAAEMLKNKRRRG